MFKNKFFFILLLVQLSTHCVDIGSDTAVGRFNTVQVLNDGDRIAGFAAIEGGFKLNNAGSDVTGIFDSFFPATGEVGLLGETLRLDKDLILRNVTDLQSFGDIIGNNHAIELAESNQLLPSRLGCDMEIAVPPFINGVITNLSSDWSFDNAFVAGTFDFTTINFPVVWTISTGAFVLQALVALPAPLTTETSIRWHPSDYLLAATRLQSSPGGDELFILNFTPSPAALTIVDSDGIDFGDYTACAWHPTGDYLAVGGTEDGAELKIYPVSSSGILDLAGTLTVAISPTRNVQREALDWDITGSFLAVGVDHVTPGSTDPDLLIYQFNDVLGTLDLTLNATALVSTGTSVLAVSWNTTAPDLVAIGIGGGPTETVEVYRHSFGQGVLAGGLAKVAGLDVGGVSVEDVHFRPTDSACLAIARAAISGSGAFQVYSFDEDALNFNLISSFSEAADVVSSRWSPNGLAASSTISFPTDFAAYQSLSNPTPFIWSDLNILFRSDVIFRDCNITFTGDCMINGRSGRFTLDDTCQLFVGSNSTLTLKDITLRGINTDIIQPVDSTGKIIFDNVRMILDADYSFTVGSFDVHNKLTIEGDGHTFNFQTDLVCTVTNNARLCIVDGVTFNYDPPIASKTLLQLEDDTSSIFINGATFTTTATAIQLTKGSLFIEGKSIFSNEGTSLGEAIELGDGTAANNLNIEWLPAANLEIQQGFVRNRNV